MSESEKNKTVIEAVDDLGQPTGAPLVFISHDSRDAELAEAFSKLLKSVSAGMIKTFVSSDKKGKEGIDFGDEWYKRLMATLQSTSDVVCLFTERSIERPWILFEAGVAKGKLNTPVIGLAVGIPITRITTGPFYQFQNMDDSEADITKLVNQLAKRVPGLELDADVVKALPSRVAERLSDSLEPFRRKRIRRFHPMMVEELLHVSDKQGDPVGILLASSMVRDDLPWLYELAMEVYRAAKSGNPERIEREVIRLRRFSEVMLHGPFMEEMGFRDRDAHMYAVEFPRMLEHFMRRILENKKVTTRRKSQKSAPENSE